jgi:hypothetical protein
VARIIYVLVFAFFLTACGTLETTDNNTSNGGSNSDKTPTMYEGVNGFILILEGDRMLVIGTDGNQEATYYTYDETTRVEDENGDGLSLTNLRIGQYVKTFYEDGIAESYPMQGKAAKVIIFKGEEYPPSNGISHALSTLDTTDEDYYPYIFSYEKEGELWMLNFHTLIDDKELTSITVNRDGDIIE